MIAVTARSLWARKRRLVATLLAVGLGVAFLAGTLLLSDTLRANFDRLFTQGSITHHTDERTGGEPRLDLEHGRHLAQFNDIRLEPRANRRQCGVDLARVVGIHRHCDVEPRLALAERPRGLEAAQMGSDQQRATTPGAGGTHERLTVNGDFKQLEAPVQQIDAVVNRRCKGENLPKPID